MKEVNFNTDGPPFLIANVRMVGDPPLSVFVTYELFYWSAKKPERKKLVDEFGNNKQDHDDFFWLVNPDNLTEPLSANTDRIVHLEAIINGILKKDSTYQIILEIYQTNELNVSGKKPIDKVASEKHVINVKSGDQFVTLRAILKESLV